MNMSKAISGKFLKCSDLDGQSKTLEIQRVEFEEVGQGDEAEHKYVLYTSDEKPLVLNKCNTESLIDAHGNESEEWAGKYIEAYPTTTKFGGKTVDCIRLRKAENLPF